MKKITIDVDKDLHTAVMKKFHHGQLTALIRNIFISINEKIENGEMMEISGYINKISTITLPKVKE